MRIKKAKGRTITLLIFVFFLFLFFINFASAWESEWNVDLINVFKFEEDSGTVYDELGNDDSSFVVPVR